MPDGTLCVEVPSTGFPSASPSQDLVVWERPYSSKGTTVGPWWNRMALPTVVQVRRTPRNNNNASSSLFGPGSLLFTADGLQLAEGLEELGDVIEDAVAEGEEALNELGGELLGGMGGGGGGGDGNSTMMVPMDTF